MGLKFKNVETFYNLHILRNLATGPLINWEDGPSWHTGLILMFRLRQLETYL